MAKASSEDHGDVSNPLPGASGTFVCSHHFPLDRRTPANPKTDYPSIFTTVSDYFQKKSPKRKANKLQEAGPSRCLFSNIKDCNDDGEQTDVEMETSTNFSSYAV